MERINKGKVTFECYGMKHESNRIAFSLMSLGWESSWAFIPWTFTRCWWQLGECLISCVVLDERKRERHTQGPNFKSSDQKWSLFLCIFLEPRRLKDTFVSLRHRDAFQGFTSTTFFMSFSYCMYLCIYFHWFIFVSTNK